MYYVNSLNAIFLLVSFHGLNKRVPPHPPLLYPLTVCFQHQPPTLLDQGYGDEDDSSSEVTRHKCLL